MIEANAKLEKPTPCRFHQAQRDRLTAASKRFRQRPAALIRQAVAEALERWDAGEPIVIRQAK